VDCLAAAAQVIETLLDEADPDQSDFREERQVYD